MLFDAIRDHTTITQNILHKRAVVLTTARNWIGTPFHLQGRQKGIGCDCVGLILGVAQEMAIRSKKGGYINEYDKPDYSLMSDMSCLISELSEHLHVPYDGTAIVPGKIALLKFKDRWCHVGIITEALYNRHDGDFRILHTCLSIGRVTEHIAPRSWHKALVRTLSFYEEKL